MFVKKHLQVDSRRVTHGCVVCGWGEEWEDCSQEGCRYDHGVTQWEGGMVAEVQEPNQEGQRRQQVGPDVY